MPYLILRKPAALTYQLWSVLYGSQPDGDDVTISALNVRQDMDPTQEAGITEVTNGSILNLAAADAADTELRTESLHTEDASVILGSIEAPFT